jgi:hypothetical protein
MPTLHCAGSILLMPARTRSEESYRVTALPHVKVYNRGCSLVGPVTGADIGKIKSYVTRAKSG